MTTVHVGSDGEQHVYLVIVHRDGTVEERQLPDGDAGAMLLVRHPT